MPCFVCRACPASPLSRSLICCDRTGLEVLQTPALLLLRDRRIEPGELPTDWICQKYPKMTKWIKDYHMLKIWISSKAFCSPFFVTALLVLNSPQRSLLGGVGPLPLSAWCLASLKLKIHLKKKHTKCYFMFFSHLCVFISFLRSWPSPVLFCAKAARSCFSKWSNCSCFWCEKCKNENEGRKERCGNDYKKCEKRLLDW